MAVHLERIKQNPVLGFRIFLAVIHFIVSIVILAFLFQCKAYKSNQYLYGMQVFDYEGYSASSYNDYTCNTTVACYRNAMPWFDGYVIGSNSYFNPYVALFVFQWITFSLSLFYITRNMQQLTSKWERVNKILKGVAIGWNMLGWLIYLIYYVVYGQSNWAEFLQYSIVWVFSSLLIWFFDVELQKWASGFPSVLVEGEIIENAGRLWNIPSFLGESEKEVLVEKKSMQLPELVKERMQVVMRYLEYACTAPILFVAIIDIMVVGAPYWAVILGYACVLGCCLYGIPLHLMHLQEVMIEQFSKGNMKAHQSEVEMRERMVKKPIIKASIVGNNVDQGRITYVHKYNELEKQEGHKKSKNFFWSLMLMGKWRINWVVKMHYLQNAWFGVMMALAIVVYLARNVMFNSNVPMYVLACLWIMLVLYGSFGVVGTLYYYMLDKKYWHTMDLALETLSFLAKVPIVMTLCAGYMNMPGNYCSN